MKDKYQIDTTTSLGKKYKCLIASLEKKGTVMVAFSGGVDSSLLLMCAVIALGSENVIAVTAESPLHPGYLSAMAKKFAASLNVKHLMIQTNEMSSKDFLSNTSERCYYCKSGLFCALSKIADEYGAASILEGSNADDINDYRPGFRAVVECGAQSPLKDNAFAKSEVRELSRLLGISSWDMPQSACLASRIPFGVPIDAEKLSMIEAAEEVLRKKGFGLFRVRYHGNIARIEIEQKDAVRMLEEGARKEVADKIKAIGFSYTVLDLDSYRLSGPENLKDLS